MICRYLYILCLPFFLGSLNAFPKETGNRYFFDAVFISLNHTTVTTPESENRFGFGFGLSHDFRAGKPVSLPFGVDYNRNSYFMEHVQQGPLNSLNNVTYHINSLSFSIGPGFNSSSRVNIRLDAGIYLDMGLTGRMRGTKNSCSYEDNHYTCNAYEVDEKTTISNGPGVYLGVLIEIPVPDIRLVIGADYRHGISNSFSYARLKAGFGFK